MDLINYLHRRVYITLTNGYYYTGLVLKVDDSTITLKDKNNKFVTLNHDVILTVQEVANGK